MKRQWGIAGILTAATLCFVAPLSALDDVEQPKKGSYVNADPFPDQKDFKATMVTVHAKQKPALEVLDEIGAPVGYATSGLSAKSPPYLKTLVDFEIENQPFWEAYFSFQVQTGLSIQMAKRGKLELGKAPEERMRLGVWSVSGPFVFMLMSIRHDVYLGREAKTINTENLALTFMSYCEPKIRVVEYPATFRLETVVDENNNSLIFREEDIPAARRGFNLYSTTPSFVSLSLKYPAKNPGRTIKVLKGKAPFKVLGAAESIAIKNPLERDEFVKETAGMKLAIGRSAWNESEEMLELEAVIERTTMDESKWKNMLPAIQGMRPRIELAAGEKRSISDMSEVQMDEEKVAAHFKIRLPQAGGNPAAKGKPAITEMTIEVPTEIRPIEVPVEFRDLPLP